MIFKIVSFEFFSELDVVRALPARGEPILDDVSSGSSALFKQFSDKNVAADRLLAEEWFCASQFKETKSATMNIFRFFLFVFKLFIKVELSYVFTINLFTKAETARKSKLSYKTGVFFSCW